MKLHRSPAPKGPGRLENSRLIRYLTSQPATAPEDLFAKVNFRQGLRGLFTRLHLGRALDGSIFLHPAFFCLLAVLLLPFLPTLALLALAVAAFLALLCTYGTGGGSPSRYSPTIRVVGLLALVYLLCTFTSVAPKQSLYTGLLTAMFLLFSLAVYYSIGTYSALRRAFVLMALGGVAVSLYGFWQWLHPGSYESGWLDEDMFSTIIFRVYATFGNPNVLGEYFLLVIPFSFALTLTAPNRRKKVLWALATALMLGCMLLTYSRGCYLGLLVAACIFLVLLDRRFLILLAVAAVLSPLYVPSTIWERILSIGNLSDTSTSYRVNIWIGTLKMLKDFWFCGVGPGEGAFNTVYPLYSLSAIDAPHSHSLYLQLLCDTGVPGLLTFLWLVGSLFRSLFTSLRRSRCRETKLFSMAGISAFAGFLLQSLTDYSFYNYRVKLLFFILVGLCLLLRQEDQLLSAEGEAGALATRDREKPLVLHILSDSNLGGAGRYLLNLFSAYDRDAYDMALVLPKGAILSQYARDLDVPVVEVDMPGEKSMDLRSILALRQVLVLVRPDIVQTHGSMSGRIAARACGARILYTRHSVFPISERLRSGLGHRVSGLLNRHYSDLNLAVSPAAADNLRELGLRDRDIRVVMNGVAPMEGPSPERAEALRQEFGLEKDCFTAGMFARLEPYKGQRTVLEATKRLKDQGKHLRIFICGMGPDAQALKTMRDELGLQDTVTLLGFIENVGELLGLMDVQLNASTGTEATSLSLIEGMSLGIPTVASRYGGTPYLIHEGQEGLLFAPGDSQGLGDCLLRLMEDSALRQQLGKTAKASYERGYTAEHFALGVQRVYNELLGKEAEA
jgi:putative inorganic carbon (HCO3(-)) transporter